MGEAIERLKALREMPDVFDIPEEVLRPLHIAATQEALDAQRPHIPVLDKRARDMGIDRVRSLDDVVPLLFAHSNYKSYPASFLAQGRWKALLQWLAMVSTPDYSDVDVEGIADIDDLLQRLWAAGYCVTTSSGTGGKLSMVPKSTGDMNRLKDFILHFREMERPLPPERQFHFFCFGPVLGTYTATSINAFTIEGFARPDSTYVLIEEPMRNVAIMRMAEMRRRMADGTATPDEIAQMEAQAAAQSEQMKERFASMADKFLELRHERVWLSAMTAQLWDLMLLARERGIERAELGPGSVITGGGGRKHLNLPDDFQEQLNDFYGTRGPAGYGMSEMSWLYPACGAGRYHVHPFAAALILDERGERLLAREGVVEGRFAFMDPTTDYRWGGLISGDKVTADFGSCPCGRKGMTILDPIRRYADINADGDKIECAGTIDAYIRGGFAQTA
ncbi:hypothetical protein [Novosphingobium pentaromativorans]|nr:hypothetical protein [Novosphingobium pentaromativorans]AIT82083.1 hypothetical protein JI59_21335 [Novosphingobium pentaromativorans US6-1]